MGNIVVLGAQWGDEGKGKMTDYFGREADMVIRYQGGHNAGHTIHFDGNTYHLHLIPSGIFSSDKMNIISSGVVVDPVALVEEMRGLETKGVSTKNLYISDRCHVIFPHHIVLDRLQEEAKGDKKIGTTGKGIGPCYVDKAARIGLRLADLLDKDAFAVKLKALMEIKNKEITALYGGEAVEFEKVYRQYNEAMAILRPHITDTSVLIEKAQNHGDRLLFEGAQGVMLDLDQGTYPYVTSSNPIPGRAVTDGSLSNETAVVGVCKAYMSRVGEGPFPTELNNELGDHIREVGHEYGVTTGRPRRIGWFDAVVMNHARRVAGLTGLTINCLDVLSGLDEVKICVGYDYHGERLDYYPASLEVLEACTPIYETMPGWQEDITHCQSFEELPVNTQNYVKRIEALTNIKINAFSVGPDRTQTTVVRNMWEEV